MIFILRYFDFEQNRLWGATSLWGSTRDLFVLLYDEIKIIGNNHGNNCAHVRHFCYCPYIYAVAGAHALRSLPVIIPARDRKSSNMVIQCKNLISLYILPDQRRGNLLVVRYGPIRHITDLIGPNLTTKFNTISVVGNHRCRSARSLLPSRIVF